MLSYKQTDIHEQENSLLSPFTLRAKVRVGHLRSADAYQTAVSSCCLLWLITTNLESHIDPITGVLVLVMVTPHNIVLDQISPTLVRTGFADK